MGQKVNPNGFRIGITHSWPSTWFAKKDKYRENFLSDVAIRRFIQKKYKDAGLSLIEIDRGKKTSILMHSSKPGVIIGKQRGLVNKCKKCDCWVPIDDDDLPDCGILVPNEAKQACSKCLEELMTEYSSEYDECVEKNKCQ
jgi:hypothetical protein